MIICPLTRSQLLSALPRNAIVAELGMAQGAFSQEIVCSCEPKRLFLVDPWEQQARADHQNDANNAPDDEQERRYRSTSFYQRVVSVADRTRIVNGFAPGYPREKQRGDLI